MDSRAIRAHLELANIGAPKDQTWIAEVLPVSDWQGEYGVFQQVRFWLVAKDDDRYLSDNIIRV